MNTGVYRIIDNIHKVLEKDISMYDETFIYKTVVARCRDIGVHIDDYTEVLAGSPGEASSFCRALNVSYSVFFRDQLVFALLRHWIIPKLINEKSSEIRIWSAGCAGGQEAYSIAMLFESLRAKTRKQTRYRIFATDISEDVLVMAKRGHFLEQTMLNLPLKYVREYFTRMQDTYQIAAKLQECVNFSLFDLLDDRSVNPHESIFGSFDIVFCSNLIMYYRPEYQQKIIKKIHKSVSKDGYIITSDAEKYIFHAVGNLRTVAPPAAVLQIS